MNVQREIDAANRRVQARIDEMAREALIRIGVDVEAEERKTAEAQRADALAPFVAWGAAFRQAADNIAAIGAAFRRGFEGGGR